MLLNVNPNRALLQMRGVILMVYVHGKELLIKIRPLVILCYKQCFLKNTQQSTV